MQNGHSSSIAAASLAKPRAGLKQLLPLAIGAIGVVYGDIGTSPLYTLRLCFRAGGPLALTPDHIVGILSLIFWSVMTIVTLKYATIIMRADNQGQGGILALMALALQRPGSKRRQAVLLLFGVAGAALFYGGGIITPGIGRANV